mmetsp:Transcript_118037/g.280202  ORF Transcript_118037/g.280202 Transcript_118037/m.280202 type:complete len:229 (-) Transcript_118037:1272-1958(-)
MTSFTSFGFACFPPILPNIRHGRRKHRAGRGRRGPRRAQGVEAQRAKHGAQVLLEPGPIALDGVHLLVLPGNSGLLLRWLKHAHIFLRRRLALCHPLDSHGPLCVAHRALLPTSWLLRQLKDARPLHRLRPGLLRSELPHLLQVHVHYDGARAAAGHRLLHVLLELPLLPALITELPGLHLARVTPAAELLVCQELRQIGEVHLRLLLLLRLLGLLGLLGFCNLVPLG